jgi:hypothetical protein
MLLSKVVPTSGSQMIAAADVRLLLELDETQISREALDQRRILRLIFSQTDNVGGEELEAEV